MEIDRYQLGPALGSGSFATVHRGWDPRLDAPVAIKLLAERWSADPAVRRRFGQEAALLRRVRNEYRNAPLVEVFDIDEVEGRPYFVMTFADRGTLADRFDPGVAWSVDRVVPIIEALAAGMGALHAAGVVHRDLKPSNLLYRTAADSPGNEQLLIGDLGLAKDLLASGSGLTVAGGSPGYMAPEQTTGAPDITPQADLHAASMVILELLSGERGVVGLDRLPGPVAAEIERGLAVRPAGRHTSATAWAAALTDALSAAPPARPEVDEQTGLEPDRVRGRVRPGSGAMIVLAAIAALVIAGGLLAFRLTAGGAEVVIDGPNEATVGQPVVLEADVPSGGVHRWVVGDEEFVDQDLRLTPRSVGTIAVRLDYEGSDGETTSTIHEIEVGP
ncbi:MAG: serine/threonine-protein kinase [Actinomycetota bacterium]